MTDQDRPHLRYIPIRCDYRTMDNSPEYYDPHGSDVDTKPPNGNFGKSFLHCKRFTFCAPCIRLSSVFASLITIVLVALAAW